MQAPAEVGVHEAAPTEAAGVEDPCVSAFLTRMVPFYEEIDQIEQSIIRLTDRVGESIECMRSVTFFSEENPNESWTAERYPQFLAELEVEMRPIAELLASVCATAAELGSLNLKTSEKSSSDEEDEEEDEDEVHSNSMAAARHFFNKTQCRIPSLKAIHRRLGELIPCLKAQVDTLMSIYQDKSAEEKQEIYKQMKLIKEEQAAGLATHDVTCRSLSDAPSSTGFKSVSPVIFQLRRRPVSPVLRPLAFVENYVDAAARLYSTEEYAAAVTQYCPPAY